MYVSGSTLTHGLVPCVTGMGYFFRVGSKPTARPISTSNYSLLRGIDTKFFHLQIIQNLYSPMDKAPGQRSPCPAFEPRTLDFFDFSLFSLFMELPLACESWVFDFNIYWPWICSRRMHIFSKHIFSKHVFSKHVFSKHVFSKHVFSKHVFSKHVFFWGDGIIQRRIVDTEVIYIILGKGCDFHIHARAWY